MTTGGKGIALDYSLLVIWACVEVSWLYSFLTISIICCIPYVAYSLIRKLAKEGATENDQKIANTTLKAVVGVAIILIIIGAILAGVGLFNPSTDGSLYI